jgi:hypothetical protein
MVLLGASSTCLGQSKDGTKSRESVQVRARLVRGGDLRGGVQQPNDRI